MFDESILHDYEFKKLINDIAHKCKKEKRLDKLFELLPLEIYGMLQFYPPASLVNVLPKMPSKEEQVMWTGVSGSQLLEVASTYVKSLLGYATLLTGKPVNRLQFLDHGCGWGRIPRFISKFIPDGQIYGLDPMQSSIDICHRDKVPGTFRLCDAYPDFLPIDDGLKFDFINVFSVFTHLNEKYQFKVLEALRKYIANDGVLAVTIRRAVFWDAPRFEEQRKNLVNEHHRKGFAHVIGGNLGCKNEEDFFGETSTSLDYVNKKWTGWKLVSSDINTFQPAQMILFMKPN